MTAIQDLPSARDFGYDFNYSLWTAGTQVTLCNVPWNSDYRDVVRFDDQAALNTYLDGTSGPTVISGATYARFGHPVRLSIPFNAAQNYNYLKVTNPAQPTMDGTDTGKTFYYFITDVQHIATNTTQLNIQVDVWQTFGYGVTFGNCYIERGHVGIANENSFSDNGRAYLAVPEGIDVGGEYQIVDQWKRDIASARDKVPGDIGSYSIMVTLSVSLTDDPGTVDAPILKSATGSQLENLPNGAENYIFQTLAHFKDFMVAFSDKTWITQGIISITAIPYYTDYGVSTTSVVIDGVSILKVNAGSLTVKKTPMKNNWRDDVVLGPDGRYQNLKKFMIYPYMVLEMTTYTGTPIVIKPESWSDAHASVVEVPHFAAPGARIAFYPYRYNAAQPGPDPVSDSYGVFNDGGEFLDMATGIFNFPAFSVVNNGYMSFMAANTHGIAFQHQSADWSQQRALSGNENSANQSTYGIATSQDINAQGISAARAQNNIANEAQVAHTLLNGMGGILNGAARGAMAGPAGAAGGALTGAGSAAMSALNASVDMSARNQSLGVSTGLAAGTNRAANDQAGYVRDTNKSYADYAAKGDYQNSIAGINAKVQDARLIQPTTSGQVGGDAFNLATYKWGYDIKVKMLQSAAMNSVGEYWLRYGYAINRFGRMPSNFQVMEKFTYWKLRETYIQSASCPENFKQALRGIFEKGVTVWNDPTDIGMIDIADNAPLTGVTL